MAPFPTYNKKVLFDKDGGLDQQGNVVGGAMPGDTVKCHMKAVYTAPRGLFQTKAFLKQREMEFLSTHKVGDTCFFEVTIPAHPSKTATSSMDIVSALVATMVLGEVSRFVVDLEDSKVNTLFSSQRMHQRAQWEDIPNDATSLILEISAFRIVRQNKEYRQKHINSSASFVYGF